MLLFSAQEDFLFKRLMREDGNGSFCPAHPPAEPELASTCKDTSHNYIYIYIYIYIHLWSRPDRWRPAQALKLGLQGKAAICS